jgi:hypothetical protein
VGGDAGPVPHPDDVIFYQVRKSLLGLHRWYTQRLDGFHARDPVVSPDHDQDISGP